MTWPTKPQKINTDLVASWLRSEASKLNNVLGNIERTHIYQDEYTIETLKSVEIAMKQIRKFIDEN